MTAPTVLFGAFDRHNLGDLLLARIAAAEEGGEVAFAGIMVRDMTPFGGPRVRPLEEFSGPLRLVHVGGELLDCDRAEAAWMLGEPEKSALAGRREAAYVVAKAALPAGSTVEFRAVGGVALAERPPAFRDEVLAALRGADRLSVRDRVTRDFLAAEGIAAELARDPASRVATLFGDEIRARRPHEGAYLAVQFAAEWEDDATLAVLARGLERRARQANAAVVLFRAGAAPWHDRLEPYERLARRLAVPWRIHEGLDIFDICALIAGAREFIGTSLHARIVAEAFGVPATSLEQAPGAARKLRAWLDTWTPGRSPVALAEFAAS